MAYIAQSYTPVLVSYNYKLIYNCYVALVVPLLLITTIYFSALVLFYYLTHLLQCLPLL